MSELRVLLMATFTFLGTVLGQSQILSEYGARLSTMTLVLTMIIIGVGLVAAVPNMVLAAVFCLAVQLGERSASEYQLVGSQSYDGEVVLVTDPKPMRNGWRVEVALANGDRVLLSGAGFASDPLRFARAGQRMVVTGTLSAVREGAWVRSRHLVGRLAATSMFVSGEVPWYQKPSEWLRDAVRRSSSEFDEGTKNLYLGLVIGDDRFQPISQRARFRAVGLSHLLAVSGQNVAFVLAVASPIMRRLGFAARFGLTLLVLVVFALATRFEPSVLRATMAAAIAAGSVLLGRRSTGCRTLGLAVTALLLIDSMLVYSVGFALSVCASLGILILGPALQRRFIGPQVVRDALAVTVSAQLGVAPILMIVFGPVSLVSVPANLFAGFAAGAVMMLGLTVGLVASAMPPPVRTVLQLPSELMVWWIDLVANVTWPLPIPVVGPAQAVIGLLGCGVLWWLRGRTTTTPLVMKAIVGSALLLGSIHSIPSEPASGEELEGGGRWWVSSNDGSSILVVSAQATNQLVDELVAHRITDIDLVVLEDGNRSMSLLLAELGEVAELRNVLAPPDHRVVDARRLLVPVEIVVEAPRVKELSGPTALVIQPDPSALIVAVVFGVR